jgi:hypothetical protein
MGLASLRRDLELANPQVGGCPQASQHPQQHAMNLIAGKGETSSRIPGPLSLFLAESLSKQPESLQNF